MSIFSTVVCTLLLICLFSFGWGMHSFFVKPRKRTLGMKVTALAALVSAVLHFQVILSVHEFPVVRFGISVAAYVASATLFWWSVRVNRAVPLAACFAR